MKDIIQQRHMYTQLFNNLPEYGSIEFWQTVEHVNFPNEVLVRILRSMRAEQDAQAAQSEYICQRLSTLILTRLQPRNERWAAGVFPNYTVLGREECSNLRRDLCADLNEAILKAIYNAQRPSWEEHFVSSLKYERLHVRHSFLMREGHMTVARVARGQRIPRHLLTSLDRMVNEQESLYNPFEIEDESAHDLTRFIDTCFLAEKVQCLPERLRTVVALTFWGDKTEQEIAEVLGVATRTVHNRLQAAMHLLFQIVSSDPDFNDECISGKS
ncbi:sigma factor-like helix-turn-helix DNA-binding protein [Dictyobacter arantiisoli]|uniref:RNA polymerase sigma factor 70 region 4 type 2 domain-containing protein n=1 Tax=Dictyobacter arantiisoli TaxID=2014874 RepID=A0A5A5TCC2_9CHLR|nr:sigma factor-like helix-turn-helix DNA-binding protein [Dictyobacter arantiisoli]GCF08845.1 hypothetical protein KDI_24090 [Dictyobacter arantiisoli]